MRNVVSYIMLSYIPIALVILELGWLNDKIVDKITDYACPPMQLRDAFKER